MLSLDASLVSAATLIGSGADESVLRTHGYIVELEVGASFSGRLASRDDHAKFHRLARDVTDYSVRHEFTNPEFFYGLSIDAKNTTDINSLLALDGVKAVYPNLLRPRPGPVEASNTASFKPASGAVGAAGSGASVAHFEGTSDVLSSLKMTGVDELHKLGITGKGIKVGIVDSGVDHRHPSLGAGFGPGFKVAGGYDFVGDDYNGGNAPTPGDDPLTTCLAGGHGTHVSGIIAGQDPEGVGFGYTGVAPDAALYMYRVFGCAGGVTDDILMQAFQRAAEDGVDVISASLGGVAYWTVGSPTLAFSMPFRSGESVLSLQQATTASMACTRPQCPHTFLRPSRLAR